MRIFLLTSPTPLMRVLPVLAPALSFVGCAGERIKESLNGRFSMQGGLMTAERQ
jgi:hypothetical protein